MKASVGKIFTLSTTEIQVCLTKGRKGNDFCVGLEEGLHTEKLCSLGRGERAVLEGTEMSWRLSFLPCTLVLYLLKPESALRSCVVPFSIVRNLSFGEGVELEFKPRLSLVSCLRGPVRGNKSKSTQSAETVFFVSVPLFSTAPWLGDHTDGPTAVSSAILIWPEVIEATSVSFLTSERWVWVWVGG